MQFNFDPKDGEKLTELFACYLNYRLNDLSKY